MILVAVGCVGPGGDDPEGAAGTFGSSGQAGTGGTGGPGGTGGTGEPTVIYTNWAVLLNGGQLPSCSGAMALTLSQAASGGPITATGSWNCVQSTAECAFIVTYHDASWQCFAYTGPVSGQVVAGGAVELSMQTEPGFSITVSGTMTPSTIVGTAMYSDASVPFEAAMR